MNINAFFMNFKYLLTGMGQIFAVMLVIIIVTMIINAVCKKKDDKSSC